MNSNKPRKACVNCYQKKVRCNWTEASPVCSYCFNHGLECVLPDPTQPPQRLAVKDKLAEIDARVRRLEEESRNPFKSLARSSHGTQKSHNSSIHITPLGENPSLVAQEWDSFEGLDTFIPSARHGSDGNFSARSNLPDGHSTLDVPLPAVEIQAESLAPVADDDPHEWDPQEYSGESRPSVRRFRGDATPWNVLVNETATSTLANGPFNETIMRLAEEESSTRPAIGNIHFDFLKEFPPITKDLVLEYANQYASEAPFQVVCWTRMQEIIERGVTTTRWTHWGEIVTVLLYVAFGSAHLRVAIPECDCEIYFKKAWAMLPQLLLEQDLWALKALTLMVHYLQGGALPESCYTLLGSASRMAISLGFHRKYYDKAYSPLEEEEGKRCWWLCYVLEKTFSLVLGRPGTNLDAFDADIPRPFSSLNDSMSTFSVRDGHLVKNSDPNDEESVAFYTDLIEVVRSRDQILRGQPIGDPSALTQRQYGSKQETVGEIVSHWRAVSQLHRPLDFDTSKTRTLRETICDLCYYNSIISLDRHIKKDFERRISYESIQAARASISIIAKSGEKGLTMCIWMWLYYAFSGAVVLFLDVIHNPLHQEATLNLALISDLENLCVPLSSFSPGAKRVMDISREMNKVAFDVIKARAKRKAQDDLGNVSVANNRSKQRHTEDPQDSMQGGYVAGSSIEAGGGQRRSDDDHMFNPIPANFSWDDWDQWLNDASL